MSVELTTDELARVAMVLRDAGVSSAGSLTATPMTAGRSNVTIMLGDGERRWVLRMPPRAGRTPSAHDVGREYTVTRGLARTAVPVPRAVALCADVSLLGGPFAIAEFVPACAIQTSAQLDPLDDAVIATIGEQLVEVLAALHAVDPGAVGLGEFGRPDGYAARQLRRWTTQWEAVGAPELTPLAEQASAALRSRVPGQARRAIVHGDYRIDNTLIDVDGRPRIRAVVDWELSTLGDPVADVAMMCAYRSTAFDDVIGTTTAWASPRLPTIAALAAAYERASGSTLAHWPFHLALAHFKIAVISAGIDYRHRLAHGPAPCSAAKAVEPFLLQSLDALRTSD